MNLSIQFLTVSQITPALFVGFVRRQQVKRCWRKESGRWVLKDIAFLDDWSPADYTHLLQKLRAILLSGGAVLAAFDGGVLAGFAAVTNEPFGPAEEYLQLSELNVSQPLRGQGHRPGAVPACLRAGKDTRRAKALSFRALRRGNAGVLPRVWAAWRRPGTTRSWSPSSPATARWNFCFELPQKLSTTKTDRFAALIGAGKPVCFSLELCFSPLLGRRLLGASFDFLANL